MHDRSLEVPRGALAPMRTFVRRTADSLAAVLSRGNAELQTALAVAEAAERRARALAEASSVLSASLDYEAMLRTVARLVISELADWCVIYMVESDDSIRRLDVAHKDPALAATARELGEYVDRNIPEGVPNVIRSRQPELVSAVTPTIMDKLARQAEHRRIIETLGVRSYMMVPLLARGRALGAIAFISATAERQYGQQDLAFALELAGRAALAVDNARLYRQAQAANQAKSEFMAVISHELRTPLTTIIACTDLLDSEIIGAVTPEQREQFGHVTASALHLLQIIEEILTFSRMEAGRENVRPEVFDVGELVRETAGMIEPVATSKGLGFEALPPDGVVSMKTDFQKLRQILLNLLSNAIKFTEEGTVSLVAREDGEHLLFEVHDQGIGIAPDHLEKIFEPFWQVDRSDTRRARGTGLGLSVTRRLVTLLGGEIAVDSTLGAGTTFSLKLPAGS